MNKPKLLLGFTGGLDSTHFAVTHKDDYDIHLFHVKWNVGSTFSWRQLDASVALAKELALPLIRDVEIYQGHETSVNWTPAAMVFTLDRATISGYPYVGFGNRYVDGEYPRYDYLADAWCDYVVRPGHRPAVMFPKEGYTREQKWEELPQNLRRLVWSCARVDDIGRACGRCKKCQVDRRYNEQT